MIFILCAVLLNPLVCTATKAAKGKSVNLNLETVLEFDNKNLEKDVQIIDNVQTFLHKVRRVLDTSKDYRRRSFDNDKIKFTDFLEKALAQLMEFKDDDLEDLAVVADEEFRKYHYKGCKFYELNKNEKLRGIIGAALDELTRMPASKIKTIIKACLKKLESRDFSEKDEEFINYVNSLYRAESQDKLNDVLKSIAEFCKTGRRTHTELVHTVRNVIRTVIFDHYSNLNDNARKDFRLKIDDFFVKYSDEDEKVPRAKTVFSDLEYSNEKFKDFIKKREKALNKTSNIAAKGKRLVQEHKYEKTRSTHKDLELIDTTTVKNSTTQKEEKRKLTRDKLLSGKDVSLKYKLSSGEDSDRENKKIFSSREYKDEITTKTYREFKIIREKLTTYKTKKKHSEKGKREKIEDNIKTTTKNIKRKGQKTTREKTSTTGVTLKHKLSSDEDKDSTEDSISRDTEKENTKKYVKSERKTTPRVTTPEILKKKRPEKSKHGKKTILRDTADQQPTTKYSQRKRHKKTTAFSPKQEYSSVENKDQKETWSFNSDEEIKRKIDTNLTTEGSLKLYPVRDLEEEKKRMPLRYISLYPETIPTTTKKLKVLKPKMENKLKKQKRSKPARMRVDSVEEPKWTSSKLKKHTHRKEKIDKPETKMMVREDRPLQEILTGHNAIIKVRPNNIDKPVEMHKEHRKRKHGRHSKPKHPQKISKLKETSHLFEMTPTSSESDYEKDLREQSDETKTRLRKNFSGQGLSIESFENDVVNNHNLYRKQNNKDNFNKRSDLRKKARKEKEEIKYRKSDSGRKRKTKIRKQYESDDNHAKIEMKHRKIETDLGKKTKTKTRKRFESGASHATTPKHKHHKHVTNTDENDSEKEDKNPVFRAFNVTDSESSTSTHAYDDYIINKIHTLEQQLENVMNKINNNTKTQNYRESTTTSKAIDNYSIHSTISRNDASTIMVTNRAKKNENIETTQRMTTKDTEQSSSEQNESDNETYFEPKLKNKSNESKPFSATVAHNNTNKTLTSAKIITTPTAKSNHHEQSESFENFMTTQRNSFSSTKKVTHIDESIENDSASDENMHKKNSVSINKTDLKENNLADNDARKLNKEKYLAPQIKFKSIDVPIEEIEIVFTSKTGISTNKEMKHDNNTTVTQTTKEIIVTKPTPTVNNTPSLVEINALALNSLFNSSKLNVTLKTESKIQKESNKTNSTEKSRLIDNLKTNKSNNTNSSTSNMHSTTLTKTLHNTTLSEAVTISKNVTKTPSKRRLLNFLDAENDNIEKDLEKDTEKKWDKVRESSDLLYKWA